MTRKRLFTILLICVMVILLSEMLLLLSLWQIEMLWICRRQNQAYVIPFNTHKSRDLWFWHDVWFLIIGASFITMGASCLWLGWRLKEMWEALAKHE